MTNSVECSDDVSTVKNLRPYVRQSLKKIIEEEGFLSYQVLVKDIATDGGNYLGTLQTVSIKGNTIDGDKELNLFLKNALQVDENAREVVDSAAAYMREGLFYNELLHLYEKIQDKYNIPKEDRISAAKGYGEKNKEVVILEDISKKGFKTYNRFESVPVKFVELSVIQLAKLHALSFVLRKEYPNYYEKNIKTLPPLYKFDEQLNIHLKKVWDLAADTLGGEAKAKLNKFFPQVERKYKEFIIVPEEKAVCMIHSDYRANNILAKEIDGETVKVVPVDYQLIYCGYPTIDLLYLIYTATDQEFRRNHLTRVKDLYYSTLKTFLSRMDIDAQEVYPKKQFEQEYDDNMHFGLFSFIVLMPFVFAKADDFPDFENGWDGMGYNMDDRYKDRLRGVVEDFIDLGYL